MVRLVGGEEVFRSRERVGETKVCDCDSAAERHRRVAHRARVDELDSRYDREMEENERVRSVVGARDRSRGDCHANRRREEVDERKRNHETRLGRERFLEKVFEWKGEYGGEDF